MNSKMELRQEAARLAVMVEGITPENVISTARAIEDYIVGDVLLPEVVTDPVDKWKRLQEAICNVKTSPDNEEATEEETAQAE